MSYTLDDLNDFIFEHCITENELDCETCKGNGLIKDAEGETWTCPDCEGKGYLYPDPNEYYDFKYGGETYFFKYCLADVDNWFSPIIDSIIDGTFLLE